MAAPPAGARTLAYSWSDNFTGGDKILYEIVLETGLARPMHFVAGRSIEGGAGLPDGRIVGIDVESDRYWQLMPTPQPISTTYLTGVDAGLHYDVTRDSLFALTGGTLSHFESAYLYRIDPDTGSRTFIGSDLEHYADSIAISPTGQAYAADRVFQHRVYEVDLVSGQLIPGPHIRTSTGGYLPGGGGLAYASDGTLWLLESRRGEIYQLDPTTGIATYVSRISVHQSGFSWGFLAIPIPEPTTFACLALGAFSLRRWLR
jgi:hypothetical protein